jgi:hypothetical protein
MPVSVERMGDNDFSVPLRTDTPYSVLKAIDLDTYAFSRIVITPGWFPVGTISTANLIAIARFVGIYLDQTDDGFNIDGAGLEWLLGGENDGGELDVADGDPEGPHDLEAMIDALVLPTNGLTKGSVSSDSNTRTVNTKRGTTRRQYLDTFCAIFQNGGSTPSTTPYEYRINNAGTVDVDIRSNLYSTTPSVILTEQGGSDGVLTGLRADLGLPDKSARDYRSKVYANWDDASALGSTTNAGKSTWVDIAGSALDYWSMVDYNPRKDFRERPNKWSVRVAANHYAMWVVASTQQATQFAVKSANDVNSIYFDVTADLDVYDVGRHIWPGDACYAYSLKKFFTDTNNQIYYRGRAISPKNLRVEALQFPIQRGMGVYMIRSDGAGGFLPAYDLTRYVAFEDDPATLQLGTRSRLLPRGARPHHLNYAAIRRHARQSYIGAAYAQAVR